MINRAVRYLLLLPRPVKRLIALAVDVCIVLASVELSYWIRIDEWIRPEGNEWIPYVLALVVALPLFVRMGLYRAIFRHTGFGMLIRIAFSCGIFGLVFASIITMIGFPGVPRTIGVLQPLLLLIAIIASRVAVRALYDFKPLGAAKSATRKRVIIYGAGAAGRQLANAAIASNDLQVVAHVDDDKTLQGGVINGLSVFPPDSLRELVEAHEVEEIILAVPSWSRTRRQQVTTQIMANVSRLHVTIRTLPSLLDLAHGKVTVNDLREIDIDDLLGRDPVPPNELLLSRNIRGKTVMVTGAGGSIGGELCRQIIAQNPERLLLVEFSEHNLYQIHRVLVSDGPDGEDRASDIVPIIANVQDEGKIDEVIRAWKPHTIYHAAAYKHVPMVEANVAEGIANNVIGTLQTALAAERNKVRNFVLISTDKAVRPTNVMGASKRLAEQILQALAEQSKTTNFSMVRFGNVLGSSGSVVPLFREQIKAGGPVTLTHADVTRYFMTIPEAAQLVIQAGAMAHGGDVFVLDMGDPVRIADLARLMIELSGLTVKDQDNPLGDIEIREVGMRPGEKLYEELLIGNRPEPTNHERIMRANEHFIPWPKLEASLADLAEKLDGASRETLVAILRELVPEYLASDLLSDGHCAKGLAS